MCLQNPCEFSCILYKTHMRSHERRFFLHFPPSSSKICHGAVRRVYVGHRVGVASNAKSLGPSRKREVKTEIIFKVLNLKPASFQNNLNFWPLSFFLPPTLVASLPRSPAPPVIPSPSGNHSPFASSRGSGSLV